MPLLLRRAVAPALIPTAIIAVGIGLLLLLCVFQGEMALARQEGSRGYTPRALSVQAAPDEVMRALSASGLDAHAYVEDGPGHRILALAPGADLSLPLHGGQVREGAGPQALIGSQVGAAEPLEGVGAAQGAASAQVVDDGRAVIVEGRRYPVTAVLGSRERSLLQYETLIIDNQRFAASHAAVVVVDGPQARELVEEHLAGARWQPQDQGVARRLSLDTFSPVLLPLGGLAGALSLWAALGLVVAWRRQEARVSIILGRTALAAHLATGARLAGAGLLGAALAVAGVHAAVGLPGGGRTLGVLGAALGGLAVLGAGRLVMESRLEGAAP